MEKVLQNILSELQNLRQEFTGFKNDQQIDKLDLFREEVNAKMDKIVKRDFEQTVRLNKIEKIINSKIVK